MTSEEVLKRMLKREKQYLALIGGLTADFIGETPGSIYWRTLVYRRAEVNSMYLRHVEERKLLEDKIARKKTKKGTKHV